MNPTAKKPRIDSKLDGLPPEQREKLVQWMIGRIGLAQCVDLVAKEFGVKSSLAAMSRFYSKNVGPYLIQKRRAAVAVAEAFSAELNARPAEFDAASTALMKQRVMELASDPACDIKELTALLGVLLKRDEHALNVTKFRFDAVKAVLANADLVRELHNSSISEDEKTTKLGQAIFGEDWK